MKKKIAALLVLMAALPFASFAGAQNNPQVLTPRQQGMVPVAAFTANGHMEKLKTALNEGLDAGLEVSEIKEILVQLYAYAGFPRSLNALNAFMSVLEEREKKGITDKPGREPSPFPAQKSSIELGTEIQTRLVGKPVSGAVFTFAPAIDRFLKGHLFGDIFGRDNLDFQSREIATISALASMDGVSSQLQSHVRVGFNTGLTETQMKGLIKVLEAKVGKKVAGNADEVLAGVLKERLAEQHGTGRMPGKTNVH